MTVEGLVAARDPHFFPEIALAHHRPDTLLLFEPDEIDHVEVVAGWEDRKLAALEAHQSQFESTMHVVGGDDEQLTAFREKELARLRQHGALVDVPLGEGFKRIDEL